MKVEYKNKGIEKICTNFDYAIKKHGNKMAITIHQRIKELKSIDTVEMMIMYRIGRCHKLKGNRKNEYALDLVHPYRIIFEKKGDEIQIASIKEIVDYH